MDYTGFMLNFTKVRELRKQLGLTLEEAAKSAGLGGKGHWADIESGRRCNISIALLDSIARTLEADPRDLLAVPVPAKKTKK